ncbi:hypothetical protein BB934_32095 (plasmid) [Microvirga ossetica]|uniref:DUF3618 domain-containing protein n=1 Tax=Microvirga ossetica TaxID=1882682 RepID=A0A1B2ESC5_9HYPH|nr:hypothetical protein [Microvirga ossetica]ANY82874.1 hypothetical protein BB934_32095 [Microvirga ossetica]
MNIPGINNRSVPDKEERQSAECLPDNKLPENSQENLDARLDHAIEETFPTSDPVSVTITKGPEPDRPDQEARPERDSTEQVLDQVREALHDVTTQASGRARELYNRGEHYVRQAGEQYPEAERYIRAGERAVTQRVTANPLLALLMAGIAGYALAWLIHGKKGDRKPDVPDYDRTHRGYAPHREG